MYLLIFLTNKYYNMSIISFLSKRKKIDIIEKKKCNKVN